MLPGLGAAWLAWLGGDHRRAGMALQAGYTTFT